MSLPNLPVLFLRHTARIRRASALFGVLADMEDGTLPSDVEKTLQYLPRGVTVGDWCKAIGETFGNNSCYCRGVGTGVTQCSDFVRLAAPLCNPKKCKVSQLLDLFRHLCGHPFIAVNGWTEEMQKLHNEYNKFIQETVRGFTGRWILVSLWPKVSHLPRWQV